MREIVTGFGLIEGPVWDPGKGLYFSDVPNGGVHLLDRAGQVTLAVARRRGIGGIALHANGGLVVGGRDVAFVDLEGGVPRPILKQDDIPGSTGFNDLTTDAAGRVYVGSLAFRVFGGEAPRPGKLHVIDLDGSMRTLSDGVMLTNGLGFSPDGRRLYHSDSRSNLVRVYDVAADGSASPWRAFAQMGEGVPDGLKVAADGSVWVADARGGRVAVFADDGAHRQDLAVPLPMVTSLCFGGDDLKDLYVVTGSDGAPSEASGTVFVTRVEVPGVPLPKARVEVPNGL
jgi:gluconolactonase